MSDSIENIQLSGVGCRRIDVTGSYVLQNTGRQIIQFSIDTGLLGGVLGLQLVPGRCVRISVGSYIEIYSMNSELLIHPLPSREQKLEWLD